MRDGARLCLDTHPWVIGLSSPQHGDAALRSGGVSYAPTQCPRRYGSLVAPSIPPSIPPPLQPSIHPSTHPSIPPSILPHLHPFHRALTFLRGLPILCLRRYLGVVLVVPLPSGGSGRLSVRVAVHNRPSNRKSAMSSTFLVRTVGCLALMIGYGIGIAQAQQPPSEVDVLTMEVVDDFLPDQLGTASLGLSP